MVELVSFVELNTTTYLSYELEFSANKVLGTFLGVHR